MIRFEKDRTEFLNVTENGEEHSMIWGMLVGVTIESGVSMRKNYQNTCHSIASTTDLTLEQMFAFFFITKLVPEQGEISGLETINWLGESFMENTCHFFGDDRIINLQRTKVHVFSDSVLCLRKSL